MDVLGHGVSPLEVVDMGTRHVHAVWKDVSFDDLFDIQARIEPFTRCVEPTRATPLESALLSDYENYEERITNVHREMRVIRRELENLRALF
jgi:hypothetical protein